MKKLFVLIFVLGLFALSIVFHDEIINYIVENFTDIKRESSIIENNSYASKNDFSYVQLTDDFYPKKQSDFKNIYYTILNSGMTDFTLYCSKEYDSCLDDINFISNNQKILSYINNFVPTYNSFQNIETEFDSLGKIDIHIKYNYTQEEIDEINKKVDEIITKVITTDMKDETKIKEIHNYIINNTKYDVERSDNKVTNYHSDTAYGALIEGYAICGGYADSMKIFLDRFNIPNFKISSENHIWNVVYLNGKWLHLDLTWDDPVTSSGKDVLEYDYFLITTDELLKLEQEQHGFDLEVYQELK